MTKIIACGQSAIFGDTCMACGGWLHRVTRGGFPGLNGWKFCDEDCIADDQKAQIGRHVDQHVGTRDLLCDCVEICAPLGLPTQEMRDEYAAYLATLPAPHAGGEPR